MKNWVQVNPVINYSVRNLCLQSYYNHPKGCPNYGKKITCPPIIKYFDMIFDLTKPVFVIYNKFDLGTHIKNMALKHPQWSEYQLRCVLYWQGKARKELKEIIQSFLKTNPNFYICKTPEAIGVNLTATMKTIGIELEWLPKHYAYQIALAGIRKDTNG